LRRITVYLRENGSGYFSEVTGTDLAEDNDGVCLSNLKVDGSFEYFYVPNDNIAYIWTRQEEEPDGRKD